MNSQILFIIALFGLVAMAWWANNSKRDQMLIYFNRSNKTQLVKWVNVKSKYVIFDSKKFDIIPDRVVWRHYNGGLVYMLFPQWIPTLMYSYNSRYPHDPDNLDYNAETPEIRNSMNKSEWVESYFKGAKPSQSNKGGKLGFLQQWLPWAALIAVVLLFFYFNSKMSGFGRQLDLVIGQLNQNAPK